MIVDSYIVAHDGLEVGDLVSLGQQYVFYTTHPGLLDLDGTTFPSVREARELVRRRLAVSEPPKPARRAA